MQKLSNILSQDNKKVCRMRIGSLELKVVPNLEVCVVSVTGAGNTTAKTFKKKCFGEKEIRFSELHNCNLTSYEKKFPNCYCEF
jgi:hypothetical protein